MRLPFSVIDCLFDPVVHAGFLPPSPEPPGDPPKPPPRRCFAHPQELAVCMQDAGVVQALVTQCRVWGCERQPLCVEAGADDVLKFVRECPQHFAGLAGFNPYNIADSLRSVDECAATGGFRGIYLNAETFAVPLSDRKLYPLYAKAVELGWAVVLQVKDHALEQLIPVTRDFPQLSLVAALRSWPEQKQMDLLADQAECLFFIIASAIIAQGAARFTAGSSAARLMWSSDGRPWRVGLEDAAALNLDAASLRNFLHDNAARVFHLDGAIKVKAAADGEPLAAER